jgi:hypothetical protein
MSFIRMGEDGVYVNIPNGSQYYLYQDYKTGKINGQEVEKFGAMIGSIVDEIDISSEKKENIKERFEGHFGWDEDYRFKAFRPERAEIFCRCVGSRIDSLELEPEVHRRIKSWVNEKEYLTECENCGKNIRKSDFDTKSYCYDDECREAFNEYLATLE